MWKNAFMCNFRCSKQNFLISEQNKVDAGINHLWTSLANAKVSVQQQCVYAKKSMANQRNEHNGKVHSMG